MSIRSSISGLDTVAGWKPGDPIEYIREQIPDFDVPAYEGERYEAFVPDTLDLQERAALAVNGLTCPTDPLADREIYFAVHFPYNPAMMEHTWSDTCQPKFMEALPLMRMVSGSDLNEEVDRRWMEVALHMIGPDGLPYWPKVGGWAQPRSAAPDLWNMNPDARHFTEPWATGRLMGAMALYSQRDSGQVWRDAVKGAVDGLARLAIERGDYAYFRAGTFGDNQPGEQEAALPTSIASSLVGWTIHGLAQAYRVIGYEPAWELAGKLVRYLKDHGRWNEANGRFLPDDPESHPTRAHFQHHVLPMVGMMNYAVAADDRELMEFLKRAYEYGKANGEMLLGYFPKSIGTDSFECSEICEVANMTAVDVKLAAAGVADCWDDVDRWVRNMFAEGQSVRNDWVARVPAAGIKDPQKTGIPPSAIDESYQTAEEVAERTLGGFARLPTANDWYVGSGEGMAGCCTGRGTRAIYYVWEHILHHEDGKLRVNLLLNRASPWADVDSHIPCTGQVDVNAKLPLDLSIRIPEWVSPGEARCQVSGAERSLGWDGRYAQVGAVKRGDVATLTFPIAERTDVVYVEKERYTLIRKGNEVVKIDTPGKYCTLYQRVHYRKNSTRWRKFERFVSNETIHR